MSVKGVASVPFSLVKLLTWLTAWVVCTLVRCCERQLGCCLFSVWDVHASHEVIVNKEWKPLWSQKEAGQPVICLVLCMFIYLFFQDCVHVLPWCDLYKRGREGERYSNRLFFTVVWWPFLPSCLHFRTVICHCFPKCVAFNFYVIGGCWNI